MNSITTTAIVLFFIGFLSDLALQKFDFLQSPSVTLFSPFWHKYGSLGAATIAGLITLIFGGLFLLLSAVIYRYYRMDTKSWSFVLFSIALAFVLGTIADVQTNYSNFIPSLRKWYDGMGATDASMWSGGLTFAFTAAIAASVWKYS